MARPSGRRGVSRDFPADSRTRGNPRYGNQGNGGYPAGQQPGGQPQYPGPGGPQRPNPMPPGRAPQGRGGRPGGPRGRTTTKKRFVDYPRSGRSGFTRWIPSWKLVGGLMLTGMGLVVAAFFAAYAATPIPDAGKQSATYQTTTVYMADGSVLGRFQRENRTNVSIQQIPTSLQDAVLAAEDRTFRTNSGISITGMIRAMLNNAQGGSLQGGSTITQQYVKNYYLSSERTYTRKVKELFISLKVGRTVEKDKILEGYLNTIYFGRNANGVQAASRAYFGKNVDKLTPSESAYLAAIIKGPELYDPADDPKGGLKGGPVTTRATERWKFVVDGMVAEGWLSADEASKMVFPIKSFKKYTPPTTPHGWKGYLLQMVKKEAVANGFSAESLETRGYDIYTTFDPKLMDEAVKAVDDMLPAKKTWPKGTRVAMASIDVKTGEIRSIYGGDDFLERQQNAATQDIMQAGSTAKPFALLAALRGKAQLGACKPTIDEDTAVSLNSRFDGNTPQTFGDIKVRNFSPRDYGFIDLKTMTANSVNTAYVALNDEIGPKQTMDAAVCAGLPADTNGIGDNLGNVLGTFSPHPIDMAHAYSTIANNGRRVEAHSITRVVLHSTKKKIFQANTTGKQVFDPQVTANAIEAMQQVVKRGSGTYALNLGRPVAGKTGTSSNNMSAWFVGFTPQVTTAVAMYRESDEGTPVELKPFGGFGEIVGGTFPVRIWTDYMKLALDGQPVKDFPTAEPIGQKINPAPVQTETKTAEPTPTQTATQTPTQTTPPTPTDTPTDPTPTQTTPTDPVPTPTRTRPTRTTTQPAVVAPTVAGGG